MFLGALLGQNEGSNWLLTRGEIADRNGLLGGGHSWRGRSTGLVENVRKTLKVQGDFSSYLSVSRGAETSGGIIRRCKRSLTYTKPTSALDHFTRTVLYSR